MSNSSAFFLRQISHIFAVRNFLGDTTFHTERKHRRGRLLVAITPSRPANTFLRRCRTLAEDAFRADNVGSTSGVTNRRWCVFACSQFASPCCFAVNRCWTNSTPHCSDNPNSQMPCRSSKGLKRCGGTLDCGDHASAPWRDECR